MFPLQRIAVVGAGVSGWLAAATLRRVLGPSCDVTVLCLPDDSAITGAVASVPSLHRLLALLGIGELALVRATQATYRLGTCFRDWGAAGERYFQGFGSIGAKLDAVPFQHHWLRVAANGDCAPLEDFCMAAQLARLGRFATPHTDSRSVLSLYSYAWHFDASLLADALRTHALQAGVRELAGDVESVVVSGEHGRVRELVLAGDARLAADFFVDCSGARMLLAEHLGVPFEDWSQWLPCDRTLGFRGESAGALPPFSEATALGYGWRQSLPLQHVTGIRLVYCSDFVNDEDFMRGLTGFGPAAGTPRIRRLLRGRPREFWVRNCLLMPGDALDPLEGTELHLAQTGITRLLAHLPVRADSPTDRREYNRLTVEEYERVRDLLALHYHATRRDDTPFWRHCRTVRVPDTLAQRLALFADSARLSIGEEEHCGADGWLAVLLGQGVAPRSYDPLADTTPLASARGALASMAAEMRARASGVPMHREFIARCGATAPQLAARS